MRSSLQGLGGVFTILFFIPIGIAWLLAKKKEKDGWSGFFKMILAMFLILVTFSNFENVYKRGTVQDIYNDLDKYGFKTIVFERHPYYTEIHEMNKKGVIDFNTYLEKAKNFEESWEDRLQELKLVIFEAFAILLLLYSSSEKSRAVKRALKFSNSTGD